MSTATITPMKCDGNCDPCSNHFGFCPIGMQECEIIFLNLRRDHYCICEKHKVCWCVGSNSFSSWHHETEEDWERNRKMLEGYEEVESVHCEECLKKADLTAAALVAEVLTDKPDETEENTNWEGRG